MMKDTCSLIPDILAEQHGFHWDCYKRFTMNLARLASAAGTSETSDEVPRCTARSISGDHIVFKPDCIFCGSENRKMVKVAGIWTSQAMSHVEFDGWKSVLGMAEKKQDEKLLTRIR